jgi:hypothetical protein
MKMWRLKSAEITVQQKKSVVKSWSIFESAIGVSKVNSPLALLLEHNSP